MQYMEMSGQFHVSAASHGGGGGFFWGGGRA